MRACICVAAKGSLLLSTLALLAGPACGAPIFQNGFEALPPATLVVHYPAGNATLTARGDGGGLSPVQGVPFVREGDTFTLVLGQIAAPVAWKPLLDDATYALGPDFSVAPGQTVEVWPRFSVAQGQVVDLFPAFSSPLLGNVRTIYAYLPPTYLENTLSRMPVVYMHDGQNLWAARPELAFGGVTWAVDAAFDSAAATGAAQEAIVIGIASGPDRFFEQTPSNDPDFENDGGADLYLRMIVEELKPAVDAALRTRAGVESTAMAGSSLGGLVTVHAGRTRPDVFGRIAALSPASWWDGSHIVADVATTPPAPDRPVRVYVDSGDSGASSDNVASTTQLANAYRNAGYVDDVDFKHVVQAGGVHSETYWAQRFPGAMQFILGPRP